MLKTLVVLLVALLAVLAYWGYSQKRLVAIERELSQPPTGDHGDADTRVSLRAERDAIKRKAPRTWISAVMGGEPRMVGVEKPVPVIDARSKAVVQVPQIVVAGDSRAAERAGYERDQLSSSEDHRRSIENTNSRTTGTYYSGQLNSSGNSGAHVRSLGETNDRTTRTVPRP